MLLSKVRVEAGGVSMDIMRNNTCETGSNRLDCKRGCLWREAVYFSVPVTINLALDCNNGVTSRLLLLRLYYNWKYSISLVGKPTSADGLQEVNHSSYVHEKIGLITHH